jgi:sensor histidine kinase regulating citrate/malate metabolism
MQSEFITGNEIADAIINVKSAAVKQHGIYFELEGTMSDDNGIQQIDICTIFSNAIDNAVEALLELNESLEEFGEKRVYIEVKQKEHFLYLQFKNRCCADAKPNGITTKSDKSDHGFGLENIRLAAEKYNGSVECEIIQDAEMHRWFCLEIMLNRGGAHLDLAQPK